MIALALSEGVLLLLLLPPHDSNVVHHGSICDTRNSPLFPMTCSQQRMRSLMANSGNEDVPQMLSNDDNSARSLPRGLLSSADASRGKSLLLHYGGVVGLLSPTIPLNLPSCQTSPPNNPL